MSHHHMSKLNKIFENQTDISQKANRLKHNFNVEPCYYWDEASMPHLGQGWVVDYIILGLTFAAGVAAKAFIEEPFKRIGLKAFDAAIDFFGLFSRKIKRQKMFFYIKTNVNTTKITVFLEDSILKNNEKVQQSYQLLEKLTFLIKKQDVFVTEYCPGPFLIIYDKRCKEFTIWPCGFFFEKEKLPVTPILLSSYSWVFINEPDVQANPSLKLDNIYLIRALFHRSLGEYSIAFSYFEKTLAENGNNFEALLELGITKFEDSSFDEAVIIWKKVMDSSRDSSLKARACYNTACAYSKLGLMEKAEEILKEANELDLTGDIGRQTV